MKLLVILPRVPYPLEKGDKLRAFHFVRRLSKDYEILLCALSDQTVQQDDLEKLKPLCTHMEIVRLRGAAIFFRLVRELLFGRLPMQVAYFSSAHGRRTVRRLIRDHRPDRIFCQLVRTAEYVKEAPGIPATLDYMDVFSKGMDRRLSTAPFYLRPLFRLEYRRLLKYERDVFDRFAGKTIISAQDRDFIVHPAHKEIHVLPNGVDTDYFRPMEMKKDFDLLFNGNMSYPPNVESVEFLVRKVLPLVHRQRPGTTLLVSGANPSPRVRALASAQVTVSGWVDDIRTSFARSRMLVAPMQLSIGLQNKLLEGMAMRLPCITSQLANNALSAPENEAVLIGHSPDDYARKILRLLSDPTEAERIAANGYRFVTEHFNWDAAGKALSGLIGRSLVR